MKLIEHTEDTERTLWVIIQSCTHARMEGHKPDALVIPVLRVDGDTEAWHALMKDVERAGNVFEDAQRALLAGGDRDG